MILETPCLEAIIKTLIHKHPVISRFILAILLFGTAIVLTGFAEKLVPKKIFPFSSLVLLILATWILYRTENKTLSELGFNFRLRNIAFIFGGFLLGLFAFICASYLRSLHSGVEFNINWEVDWKLMLLALYYLLPMVAVEEFLFRGYLFKKTISISSVIIANSIFAIIFMLIHVVDESVLQSPGRIVMLVIAIPIGHLLFATALLKSKTIFFPIGIHLGNNWGTQNFLAGSKNEAALLYTSNSPTYDTWIPFLVSLAIFNLFYLFIIYLIWNFGRKSS